MAIVNRNSPWLRAVSIAVVVVVFGFIGRALYTSAEQIDFARLRFNGWLLAVALAVSFAMSFTSALLWHLILHLLDEKANVIHLWRVMVYSQIVRYLPGKIWMMLGRVHWGAKLGLSGKKILLSIVLENVFLVLGATVASVYVLRLFLSQHFVYLFYGIASVVLACLHPRILGWITRTIGTRWLGQNTSLHFSYLSVMMLVVLYCIQWLAIGANYFLFVRSFYPVELEHFFEFTTYVAASWLAGYLSIIAPAGLGVREGVFILVFKTVVPLPVAILTALLIRLFGTISEVVVFAVFVCFDRGAWNLFLRQRRHIRLGSDNASGAD